MSEETPIIEQLPDGVYFGLPFEQYLGQKRCSFHACKDILISPLTCWTNYIDPDREDVDTKALKIGRAFHARILEGEDIFRERFAVKPENDGTYLEGNDALKEQCDKFGLKKSGTAIAMCERILEFDPGVKLWAIFIRDWMEANKGKDLLTTEQWKNMERPAQMIAVHPQAGDAFRGGYSEVSVFWTDKETGVRMKNRPDYVKIKSVLELKTFANQTELPISRAIARALRSRHYHMQGRIVLEAIEQAKAFIKAGKVFGDVNAEWSAAFADSPDHKLIWIFIQSGRVSEIRLRKFDRFVRNIPTAPENLLWSHGMDSYRFALGVYAECVRDYVAEPWISPEPMRGFQDEEFGAWAFE